jgi:plasmid stabilization system protein ParE
MTDQERDYALARALIGKAETNGAFADDADPHALRDAVKRLHGRLAEVERLRERIEELHIEGGIVKGNLVASERRVERLREGLRQAVDMLYRDDWTPEDRDALHKVAFDEDFPRGGVGREEIVNRWRLRRIRHGIALRTGPRRGIAFTWRPLRIWNDLRRAVSDEERP